MIPLIQAATSNQSNEERKIAEKTLIDIRQQNPQQFFKQVVTIFASKEAPQNARQSAGTLVAVSVVARSKSNAYIWDTLSGNMKNLVKQSVLEILIDTDRNVRRAAANIVSAICYVELPRNQWPEIVQQICVNINHENEIVKQASILTLGFICSRMKEKENFIFSPQTQDNILSGIILGLQQQNHFIIETSLKALRDSISSLPNTMSNQQYRTFILQRLAEVIANEKYRVDGLQILGEFVRTCYLYLKGYVNGLTQILIPIMADTSNEDACVASMEIWENMANQYEELSTVKGRENYITGENGQYIVGGLLKNLICMQDSQDSDDNPISDSASKALQTIFENGAIQYKALVLEFVKFSISQNDWKHKQASIKAFSLILYGLPDQDNQQLISSSINQLMNILSDTSRQVQFAALDSLTIMTEVGGKYILMSPQFFDYLQLILSKIQISEKFLKTGCKIVDNLCQAEKKSSLGKFAGISDDIIGFFLKFALANDSSLSVVSWATATIMNIIEVAHNQAVIKKYLAFVLENFDKISTVPNAQKRQLLTSAFFTIMQFCLHGLKSSQVQQALINEVYQKVVGNFRSKNDVNADGLYAVSVLVSFFQQNLALIDDFWVYITHALTKWQDPALFRATTNCIVSFMNCYGDALGSRLDTFVPTLIQLILHPAFAKELKLDCMVVLGQVFLICKDSSLKYLSKTLQVILHCCNAVIPMTETDFGYAQQLKDTLVQTLMCIANAETDTSQIVTPYIPSIFEFVKVTCDKKVTPTVSYMKRCVLLMADFAKTYPTAVAQLKRQPFVVDCINTLKNVNHNREHDSIILYAEAQLLR